MCAAAFAAVASLLLAAMVIIGPGLKERRTTEVARVAAAER